MMLLVEDLINNRSCSSLLAIISIDWMFECQRIHEVLIYKVSSGEAREVEEGFHPSIFSLNSSGSNIMSDLISSSS